MLTVRRVGGFPGDQTVGLPTLVQNPPTANSNGNPTGLDRRVLLYGLVVVKLNSFGLAVVKPNSFWVAGYPTQSIRGRRKRRIREREKKTSMTGN